MFVWYDGDDFFFILKSINSGKFKQTIIVKIKICLTVNSMTKVFRKLCFYVKNTIRGIRTFFTHLPQPLSFLTIPVLKICGIEWRQL